MKRREFTLVLAATALDSLGGSAGANQIEGFATKSSRDDGWNIAAGDDDKPVDTTALGKMADRLAASDSNIHSVLVVPAASSYSSATCDTRSAPPPSTRHRGAADRAWRVPWCPPKSLVDTIVTDDIGILKTGSPPAYEAAAIRLRIGDGRCVPIGRDSACVRTRSPNPD